jgi:hypothetical protein
LAEYYGSEQHHKFKDADGKEDTVSSNAKIDKRLSIWKPSKINIEMFRSTV